MTGQETTNYTTYETGTSSTFDNENFTRDGTRNHYGNFDFFRVNIPLDSPGSLNAGQYQFNFRIDLPSTLPPSFYYSKGGDRGEVIYKLCARASKGTFSFDIKGRSTITILAPYYNDARPIFSSSTKNITQCCCLSQGHATAQISLDRDVVVDGENVEVVVQARNESSQSFQKLRVKLKRRVKLSSNSTSSTSYYTQLFTDTMASFEGPGLRPGEIAESSTARRVKLTVPANLPPTLEGRLIQCHYVVEAELKAGLGTSSIRTSVPVRVTAKEPPVNDSTEKDDMESVPELSNPPSDWKPREIYQIDPVKYGSSLMEYENNGHAKP